MPRLIQPTGGVVLGWVFVVPKCGMGWAVCNREVSDVAADALRNALVPVG